MSYMRFTGLGKLVFIAAVVATLIIAKYFGVDLNTKNINIILFIAMTIGLVGGLIWATLEADRPSRNKGENDLH